MTTERTVAPPLRCAWLRELAAGYLRGFRSQSEKGKGLWGYAFVAQRGAKAGIFVGFLTAPECVVYVFVRPATSPLHRKLARGKQSLLRQTFQRIVKYTARRPRWEFHERAEAALIRHIPLAEFPPDDQEKYARNFFVETLSLLVRSGLPAALQRLG